MSCRSFPMTLAAMLSYLLLGHVILVKSAKTGCTYIPGDDGWPSQAAWATLNETVGGRLIETVPIANVCHDSLHTETNDTACAVLAAGWDLAKTLETHPGEIMNPYYQNQSCDPFTPKSKACELGNLAVFSINVTGVDDVLAGIHFAQEKNVRLVIKTTGHDFVGRSTGHGALALWMWNLKTTSIIERYNGKSYSGPAMRVGAGMIAGDAYEIASAAGLVLVGGECGSVGLAGGYTQGGGHSMLSTIYGMGSDQVLEWEVITANGSHLVATPEQNSDLYWAFSGGGGGTYGVVLSMTVRAYRDEPYAGASLVFVNTNDTAYWEAVSLWIGQAAAIVADNNTAIWVVEKDVFVTAAITLPGQPESAVTKLLAPFVADLNRLGIQYQLTTTHFDTYLEHTNAYFGPMPYGKDSPTVMVNNRLIPATVIETDDGLAALVDALKLTVSDGQFIAGCAFVNVSKAELPTPANAVLPAWRDSLVACNVNGFWNFTAPLEQNLALKKRLVEVVMPVLEAASPGGGVYVNEMDPWYKGEWKEEVYGVNYKRLLEIKHAYDPTHTFWGHMSVGSDELVLDEQHRLCRAIT